MAANLDIEYSNLGFNPDVLRDKYRQERDRRIRPQGNAQYRQATDQLAPYVDDRYVEPGFTRAPIHAEMDAVIVGGGFSGLLAGARFCEAGIEDFPNCFIMGLYHQAQHIAYIIDELNTGAYGPGANAFNDLMVAWRTAGTLDALELRRRSD